MEGCVVPIRGEHRHLKAALAGPATDLAYCFKQMSVRLPDFQTGNGPVNVVDPHLQTFADGATDRGRFTETEQ